LPASGAHSWMARSACQAARTVRGQLIPSPARTTPAPGDEESQPAPLVAGGPCDTLQIRDAGSRLEGWQPASQPADDGARLTLPSLSTAALP
jgi:hypothetical protein